MLYSWNDRAAYTNYQVNESLSAIESKTGRLEDSVRDVVIAELTSLVRNVILDVVEEHNR